ncbi:hypothetical protein FA15DRAFT_669165 [Coprinopsis marcescibilis]|uniref:Uncharacterized protein n=1 Tax=Coprinopsis marcescibilis TaxID=230819 RepID=A0A5C3KW12_COPMA|nr:hypothetical protein FA15DRAFT_669165 [Coprinopsis marcescibilis]
MRLCGPFVSSLTIADTLHVSNKGIHLRIVPQRRLKKVGSVAALLGDHETTTRASFSERNTGQRLQFLIEEW